MSLTTPITPWRNASNVGRWSTLGPYYAMFPVNFVRRAISAFCEEGGAVLDPFCGRGTVPFVARATGRRAVGIDLNPVAFVFASAKTAPALDEAQVIARISEVAASTTWRDRQPQNEFQRWAWCQDALGFLRSARRALDWNGDQVDRTLMAIILVHLHGKLGNAISNQMRQTKGMSPDYSVSWWKQRRMKPPQIDPVRYFTQKVQWRYRHGVPSGPDIRISLDNAQSALRRTRLEFSMLLTSPPYCGVTNYRADNWIRLWMLGEDPLPNWETEQRYVDPNAYTEMLTDVFRTASGLLKRSAPVLVRTDARTFTRQTTATVLSDIWPHRRIYAAHGRGERSQTRLFGDHSKKPGEVDLLVLTSQHAAPRGFVPLEDLEAKKFKGR